MNDIELFVLAWISGNGAIPALAVFSRLSLWWFHNQVEEYVRPLFLPPSSSSPFSFLLRTGYLPRGSRVYGGYIGFASKRLRGVSRLVILRMMISSESNRFDVTKYNPVALIGPIQIHSASHFPRHVHPVIEAKNTRSWGRQTKLPGPSVRLAAGS